MILVEQDKEVTIKTSVDLITVYFTLAGFLRSCCGPSAQVVIPRDLHKHYE